MNLHATIDAINQGMCENRPIWPKTLRWNIRVETREERTPHVELSLRATEGANVHGVDRRFLRPPPATAIASMLQALNRAGAE